MNVEGTEERLEVAESGLAVAICCGDGYCDCDWELGKVCERKGDLTVEVGGLGRKAASSAGGEEVRSMTVGERSRCVFCSASSREFED